MNFIKFIAVWQPAFIDREILFQAVHLWTLAQVEKEKSQLFTRFVVAQFEKDHSLWAVSLFG